MLSQALPRGRRKAAVVDLRVRISSAHAAAMRCGNGKTTAMLAARCDAISLHVDVKCIIYSHFLFLYWPVIDICRAAWTLSSACSTLPCFFGQDCIRTAAHICAPARASCDMVRAAQLNGRTSAGLAGFWGTGLISSFAGQNGQTKRCEAGRARTDWKKM